jgi:hypothetical protein
MSPRSSAGNIEMMALPVASPTQIAYGKETRPFVPDAAKDRFDPIVLKNSILESGRRNF